MAIQISKEFDYKGIKVPSLYGRVEIHIGIDFSHISTTLHFFSSKKAYKDSVANAFGGVNTEYELFVPNTDWCLYNEMKYDPKLDGDDMLGFIHQKLLHILTTDISHEEGIIYNLDIPVLEENGTNVLDDNKDPIYKHKIGDPMLDSEGKQAMRTVVTREKLCEVTEFDAVDL